MALPTDGEPRPRAVVGEASTVDWPVLCTLRCAKVTPPQDTPFSSVLERRRSRRRMSRLPLRELSSVLAFALGPRAVLSGDRRGRSLRPSPSAGALHPVELLLVDGLRVFRYMPMTHELDLLRVSRPEVLRAFSRECGKILPTAHRGTAVVLAGEMQRVATVYEHPESLLWRDAGALLQTLALVVAAYGLAFCPLGILGRSVLEAIGLQEHLIATGVGLIGSDAAQSVPGTSCSPK